MEVRSQVDTVPAFASVQEALAVLKSAMGYLAAADVTQLPTSVQTQCLQTLEQVDAIETAARSAMLAGFTAAQGYCEDADCSPTMWLVNQTRVTKGAAAWTSAPPRRRPPAGRRRDDRRRGVGVLGPDHLRLDGPAARKGTGGGGRDFARRRPIRAGPAGRDRSGRRDVGPWCPSRPGARQITGWKWPAGWIRAPRGYPIHPEGPIHPDNPAPAAPGTHHEHGLWRAGRGATIWGLWP